MEQLLTDIAVVIVLSAVLSWVAFFTRQPIIIAYIACGVIAGPRGLSLVHGIDFVDGVSRIGITLLLFLAGIVLHPRRLFGLFRKTLLIALAQSTGMFVLTFAFTKAWGFSTANAVMSGTALMFSSTILVVKLLPTTTLHQKRLGSMCIAILIIEDLLAVLLLMFMNKTSGTAAADWLFIPLKGALLIGFALLFEQFVLRRVMAVLDQFHEILYLSALAWCLGTAMLAHVLGFNYEVGAFIAGVALARSPLSFFFSEGLKFFRDFFLVLFFFVLGARIDLFTVREILLPALIMGVLVVGLKPLLLRALFRAGGETPAFAKETGVRLGQASEFSLIVAVFAADSALLSRQASQFIQMTTIVTMIISSYVTVFAYPTPLGMRKRLKQD